MSRRLFPTFPTFIGFDDLFEVLENQLARPRVSNWPPYDIIKEGNNYKVEFALAGFDKKDISITVDGDQLVVKGSKEEKKDGYVWKGISNRAFEQRLTLNEGMKVDGAEFINGILTIGLKGLVTLRDTVKQIELK